MPPEPIDKARARRAFARAAGSYDEHALLQREIGERLLERLELVLLQPRRVLDLGCGTGVAAGALLKRYPKAEVIALDFSHAMLVKTRQRGRFWRRPRCLCADMEKLPLPDQSMDLVYANASLQWATEPAGMFRELARVLAPEGLLMFSSFGPDTLWELRSAWATVDDHPHVHDFTDLHVYGDLMVQAGLADPVMDMEHITLTYPDVAGVMQDIRGVGAVNAVSGRERGLLGRRRLKLLHAAYEAHRRPDGTLPATYEVVYGHAWGAAQRRLAGGETRIAVESLRPGKRL